MFVKCSCGGDALYDTDNCGHEWVTCNTCKFEIERYESEDIEGAWAGAVNKKRAENPARRYLTAHDSQFKQGKRPWIYKAEGLIS